MMTSRPLYVPPVIHFGEDAAQEVGPEAKSLRASKALLVTDKILKESGTIDPICNSLTGSGLGLVMFDSVNSEPVVPHVEEGVNIFKREACDMVIACGGGSCIDVGKAIIAMLSNPGRIQDYIGLGKISRADVPLIAVPTTAGTGSEVTTFTIITDPETDVKMLIGSPVLMPKVAIVDPLLTLNMPRGLTSGTGLDALIHAIEAYVSLKAQPMSDLMALSAIRLLSRYLPQAWANPENREARSQTMLGAMQAGIAFSNASVALVHGMSRPIGAYFHVPHGVSNAALLGVVMEFSLMGAPHRYADIAEALGAPVEGCKAMEAARAGAEMVKSLIKQLEIPSLKELGVSEEELERLAPKMAADAIASGSPGNNPRKATKEEIVKLYFAAL